MGDERGWGKRRTFGDDAVEAVGTGDGLGGLVTVVVDLVVGERSGEPARLREDGGKEEEPRCEAQEVHRSTGGKERREEAGEAQQRGRAGTFGTRPSFLGSSSMR